VNASRRYSPDLIRPPVALSSRPGTIATPCRSAVWANAPLSWPLSGSFAHTVRPPSGTGQVQSGRYPVSALASAS
jgi:hypothetical protein